MLYEAKMNTGTLDQYREVTLCRLISAGIKQLKDRGVEVGGVFTYTTEIKTGDPLPTVASWSCSIEDERVITAVMAYVMAKAPWMEEKEKFEKAWESMLDNIANTGDYRPDWEDDSDG